MPYVFTSSSTPNNLKAITAAQSNLFTTPITNLTATSTVAGQIVVTWSGGLGNNVKYSYALSSGTIQSTSGQNPTTITLTSTTSISTTVTLTASVLGGSTSTTSGSVTTNSGYSTTSGANPLIAYNFVPSNYTSTSTTSGYFKNVVNNGVDDLYVFNTDVSTVPVGTTTASSKTFNYIDFNQSNSNNQYKNATSRKASINNNNTSYSNYMTTISSSTSLPGFTITYWIRINTSANPGALWNRFTGAGGGAVRDYQIYTYKSAYENAGGGAGTGVASYDGTTWYFCAMSLNSNVVTNWGASLGSTFPATATGTSTASVPQAVNANAYFVFGAPQWSDANSTFYMSDFRIYGSNLSRADLNDMFTNGPK